ncbi:MAG: SDR family NAD(P)-dependent oxidoreductase [Dehalococcoidia bacterium]|nr:SDR family NAD(P)-dependent oxidoreductase [Dehalococcoidia bacterium]
MGERLKGRVAVVTGAGRGLGRCHALLLADEGAKVVVNDLGGAVDGTGAAKTPADEVVAEIKKKGGKAVANYENVASYEGAERLIKTALDEFGRLDILINNAGVLRDRMVFNMTEEEWDTVMKVHLYGHFNCTKHACIIFRQQRSGRIVNTSSDAGLGNMGQANYSAAKEGIVGLTRTVARDMGRYGVTCNAIRPMAATRMTMTPELAAAWAKRAETGVGGPAIPGVGAPAEAGAPLAGLGAMAPEAVSPFVVFLCTDEAANINGCNFSVGGGDIRLFSEPQHIRSIHKKGIWTVDELCELVPTTLAAGLVNPSPPAPPKA